MILTPAQLHALTGRVRPSAQRRTLDKTLPLVEGPRRRTKSEKSA